MGGRRIWTRRGDIGSEVGRRVSNGVRHGMQLKSVRVGLNLFLSADHNATDTERADAFGHDFGRKSFRQFSSHVWEIEENESPNCAHLKGRDKFHSLARTHAPLRIPLPLLLLPHFLTSDTKEAITNSFSGIPEAALTLADPTGLLCKTPEKSCLPFSALRRLKD